MRKPDILQVCQAGSFLLCASLAWQITSGYEGTEFSSGWLTGPLLSMEDIGAALFIVASALTFVFPRVAAAIGLAASGLCFPLYSFFIASVPFAQVFARGHEFKVQPVPGVHWDSGPVVGLFALAVTLYFCIRCLSTTGRKQIPQRAWDLTESPPTLLTVEKSQTLDQVGESARNQPLDDR